MLAGIPGIDLGLHLTLNSEWPMTKWGPVSDAREVPALVDGRGYFYADPEETNKRNPPVAQLMAEAARQLDCARHKSLRIAYLDEHMGVSWLPGFREELKRFAARERLVFARRFGSLPWDEPRSGDTLAWLREVISAMSEGAMAMVTHPMFDDASGRQMLRGYAEADRIITEREADRRLWLDERLPAMLAELGVVPARYSEVP
jgi:predicted glycoside hydrolase/deacetylase ChbG (UPF0249 family)